MHPKVVQLLWEILANSIRLTRISPKERFLGSFIFFTHESLMGRTKDEPFRLYGLIAESINTDEDRTSVEFKLCSGAKFSDDSPIKVEDVIWIFKNLGTEGHQHYRGLWSKISSV